MADNIVVKYQSNLDEVVKELTVLRNAHLGLQKQVDDLGNKSKAAADKTSGALKETGKQASALGNVFASVGKQIAIAFSTAAVVAFGKSTVDAFIKAELSAKKLQTAVGAGGGLSRDFNILIQQSKELQKTTIFNDETIQDAQTMALQFGLSAQQVKELIPLIIDFASATGQDLGSALSTVLRGTTGQTRGLKVYGVEVDASATRTQKFTSIVQQLTDKFQGQGKIVGETVGGRLKILSNAWDELKESIGGALAPLVAGAAELAKNLLSIVDAPLSQKLKDEQVQLELTAIKLSSLNEGSKERSQIIKQLQAQYPQYLGNINAEKVSNIELQKALSKVNDQLVLKIALAKGDEQIVDAQEKVADALIETSKWEGILISQIRQRLEQAAKSNPIFTEALKIQLQGLSLNEQAAIIGKEGLDVSGQLITSVNQRTKAEGELKKAQDELAKAQQKRIEEEQRLRGILNIPVTVEAPLSTTGDFNKKTDEEIRAEEEAAKKIREAQEKAAAERRQAQESLKDFTLKTFQDNLTIEESQRKLAAADTIQGEQNLAKEILAIELDTLNKRLALLIEFQQPTADIEKQIADKKIEQIKRTADVNNEQQDAMLKDYREFQKLQGELAEEAEEKKREQMQQTFDLAHELTLSLQDLFRSETEQDLSEVQTRKDARLQAIDEQIEALEDANDRGRVSDKKLEQQKKQLLLERAAVEKKAQAEENKIKRQDAERDKALSLFRIGLILAEAIASGNAFRIIAASAQLVVVAATPIPAFKRGTKGKKQTGLGLVGEEGPELVWMPEGSKVVTAGKTRQYKEAIDSMIEGTFDEKYVYKAMIASALREATRQADKQKQKTFAENIAHLFNVKAEIDPYRLADGIKSNNKELAWYIGKAVAKNLSNNNSNDRYYR